MENITEMISNNNKSSLCQQLLTRLEQLKTQLTTPNKDDKQIWLQFLSLWREILQNPLSNVQSCYVASAQLLTELLAAINFDSIIKDESIACETTFTCMALLNQLYFKNYVLRKTEQKMLPRKRIHDHIYLLLVVMAQTIFIASLATIDDRQCIENYIDFFTLLIDHVDQSMPEFSQKVVHKDYGLDDINESILILLWNAADQTGLVPTLLKCGLAKRVVTWLAQSTKLTEKSRRPLISIVHNIARHDDGADELNNYGAIDIIKQYQKTESGTTDSRILIASMALALLSTPEQLKSDKKGMNVVLNHLLQLVMNAAKNDRYRCDGFHVSEPLAVMVKMFVVDERTLDYVLCHAETEPSSDMFSTIQLFVSLLFDFSQALKGTNRLEQFTLIAIFNILWSISFQPNYAPELIKNQKLIETIKNFIDENYEEKILEQYKPRSMEGIKEAAHGILHNLKIDNQSETAIDKSGNVLDGLVPNTLNNISSKPCIMISYCHDNNTFCDQILSFLSERNDVFDIWIDRTYCQSASDLWESIADGMERSCVIVCLVSRQYFESKSCRKEFIYAADTLKKTIVPVLLENFKPRGWLGIRIPDMKYIRFRDLIQPEQTKIVELMNAILLSLSVSTPVVHENLPSSSQQHTITLSIPATTKETSTLRPFNQWTSSGNDITAWFAHHRISRRLCDLFEFQTGKEMLDYAELLIKDRENQMNIYAKIFAEKYNGSVMPPHEFYRFSAAMKELLNDNRSSLSSANKNSLMPTKSSTCII
ncbi:unnamed protein product [Rotaria sordida]|uniref:TIR domain-containing protein n=1 Tax=Rotaria sordida TaxID=392033 RepID=A0A819EXW2_9BILA|nr:unnamed protein product [Rotaria sordida]CAF3857638.1 unnamed protein product [Rotaria sordida]